MRAAPVYAIAVAALGKNVVVALGKRTQAVHYRLFGYVLKPSVAVHATGKWTHGIGEIEAADDLLKLIGGTV